MVYIETNSLDIHTNLSTEYYIATESDILKKSDDGTAFVFWYTTPTLVIGRFQNLYQEINVEYAREHNLNIARRMSGGGTMYMDEGGWQFAFITDRSNIKISFAEFLAPIVSALASLGISAEFSGRNDILIDGKKVSGNSQYKLGNVTVHHGTLLFDTDLEKIVKATTVSDYKIISKGIKSVRERVTNISDHMKIKCSHEEFKELMVRHILKDGTRYTLSDSDKARIEEIADVKFRSRDIVYGTSPKFSISKTAHFKGGTVEMYFDVKKGRIEDCLIQGDFFSAAEPEKLKNALCGCLYEYTAICSALINAGLDGAIYDVTTEELAGLMTE